jgi:hypothetical protein
VVLSVAPRVSEVVLLDGGAAGSSRLHVPILYSRETS